MRALGKMLVHVDHGVSDRFAAENAVSHCNTGFSGSNNDLALSADRCYITTLQQSCGV